MKTIFTTLSIVVFTVLAVSAQQQITFVQPPPYFTAVDDILRIRFKLTGNPQFPEASKVIFAWDANDAANDAVATQHFSIDKNEFIIPPYADAEAVYELAIKTKKTVPPPTKKSWRFILTANVFVKNIKIDSKDIEINIVDGYNNHNPAIDSEGYESAFNGKVMLLENKVECKKQKVVMPETFSLLSQDIFSRLAPDITGDDKQGSGISATFNDKDAKVNAQIAVKAGNKSFLLIGANTSVAGATEFFSGKKGIRPGWGVKLGFSSRIANGLFYEDDECPLFHLQRSMFLDSIYTAYKKTDVFHLTYIDSIYNAYKNQFEAMRKNGTWKDHEAYTSIRDSVKKWSKIKADAASLYGDNDTGPSRIRHMENFLQEKTIAFEKNNAKWTGYWLLYASGNVYYNSKSYSTYSDVPAIVSKRFDKISFNNAGISASINYLRQTRRWYQAITLSFGLNNRTTFDLPENQKYFNTYQTETTIPDGDTSAILYTRDEQKAYNKDSLVYDEFWVFSIDGQYTALFGKRKNAGVNVAINYGYSNVYTPDARIDIQMGPMFVIPGKDDEISKANFGFYAAYRNCLATGLARDKFGIGLFLRVPVSLLKY